MLFPVRVTLRRKSGDWIKELVAGAEAAPAAEGGQEGAFMGSESSLCARILPGWPGTLCQAPCQIIHEIWMCLHFREKFDLRRYQKKIADIMKEEGWVWKHKILFLLFHDYKTSLQSSM